MFCRRGDRGWLQTPLLPLLPKTVALEQGAGSLGEPASPREHEPVTAEPWGPVSLCSAWLPWVTATAVRAPGPWGQFLGVKFHGLSTAWGPQPNSRRCLPLGACLSSTVGVSPGQQGSGPSRAAGCDDCPSDDSLTSQARHNPGRGAWEEAALPGCPELPWGLSPETAMAAAVRWLLAASRAGRLHFVRLSSSPTERRVGVLQPQREPKPWRRILQ